ncbi:MAG: tetratricopeptide repeat protein [Verrucomicrobia bacterium]|nr:tetratricopeptide repeat protein [Verrucomicrobiota bacterium]
MAVKPLDELPDLGRQLYKKANDAVNRQIYGYAIDLLNQILEMEPSFLDGRKLLRGVQWRQFQGMGTIKQKMAGMSSAGAAMKAQGTLKKNPAQAMVEAERVLNGDPGNATALGVLADGAEATQMLETAAFALESLRQTKPDDVKLLKRLGEFYNRTGENEKARQVYELVLKLKPDDADAFKAMKDATAKGALQKGGWEKEGDFRGKMKDQEEAKSLEQESRVVKSDDMLGNLIAETEQKLQDQPSNLAVARQLARYYREKGRFDDALSIFTQVQQHQAADPALEKEISETHLRRMDAEIAAKEAALQQTPDNEALKQELAAAQQAREEYLLKESEQRVERYPNDLSFRFDLGELYFKSGNIKGAIEQFQKGIKHPQLRTRALSFLGQCFMAQKLADLAIRQFTAAISEIVGMDDLKLEVLYHLGVAYETKGLKEKADECYQQIYEVDMAYRDVGKRLGLG